MNKAAKAYFREAKKNNQSPITTMNWVVDQAASETRGEKGYMLVSRMLSQLTVVGVGVDKMILFLAPLEAPDLRPSILKRKDKILDAIQRICPQVTNIDIVDTR